MNEFIVMNFRLELPVIIGCTITRKVHQVKKGFSRLCLKDNTVYSVLKSVYFSRLKCA